MSGKKNEGIFRMIINATKIILAAIGAVLLAQVLQLEFAISAGIVAILTIQPTKRETVSTALGRLYAFVVAMVIAFVSFKLFGLTMWAFFAYLVLFIFVCQIFKWHSAMAMNSVLISHFITFGVMDLQTVNNEVLIFVIGVGAGILANMHLGKRTEYMEKLIQKTDAQIVKILSRMSERVLDKDISDYNGDCFHELATCIDEAKAVAKENFNNQLIVEDTFDMDYIEMRDKQRMVLFEMYKNVRRLDTSPMTAGKIADFLKNMSEVFAKGNDCKELMRQLDEMNVYMKSQPLPTERKEFEDRARLFGLMRNLEEFLTIKMSFMEKNA